MKLIVGLGNPGRKYEATRHNVGFDVLVRLAKTWSAGSPRQKFAGEYAEAGVDGQRVTLLWPHTYMNASGQSVRQALDFYKTDPADLLVVCDDLNLSLGRLRLRPSGSAGGQKGMVDIIRVLGTDQFPRLRIGIGRPPAGRDVVDFVLGRYTEDESAAIRLAIDRSEVFIRQWLTQDITAVMSRCNSPPES